jgi:hypothetical protein
MQLSIGNGQCKIELPFEILNAVNAPVKPSTSKLAGNCSIVC